MCREVRRRERTEKDLAESRARAEALAMEAKERKQEAFLAEQRMQRMDAIAKEQRVRQPFSFRTHHSISAGEKIPPPTQSAVSSSHRLSGPSVTWNMMRIPHSRS